MSQPELTPQELIDVVFSSVQLVWGSQHNVRLRFAKVFYDDGMDPVVILIYDERFAGDAEWQRRIVYTQGTQRAGDYMLDWEEGW